MRIVYTLYYGQACALKIAFECMRNATDFRLFFLVSGAVVFWNCKIAPEIVKIYSSKK